MRSLVFIHGRAQEHKDATALKKTWVDALTEGLAHQGLTLPIPESEIRFPYYGQTLFDIVAGKPEDEAAEVIIRGEQADDREAEFLRQVLNEVIQEAGITQEQMAEIGGQVVVKRGPANWEWVQTGLKAIDTYIPGASAASIALATRDVYLYLRNAGLRDIIETGILEAFQPRLDAVVVGHSLGTIVAYNIVRREGERQGWQIPLFTTLGSPLGITAVRQALAPIRYPKVVSQWFNAFDTGDIVALYPLDQKRFPVEPPIENWGGVENNSPNQHGIHDYLSDTKVAKRIYDALTA